MSPTSRKMTHPLTDEMIIELIGDRNLFHCLTEDDMRAAADWQLEQVIDWLKAEIFDRCIWPHEVDTLPRKLQNAMRPQQQDDNQ